MQKEHIVAIAVRLFSIFMFVYLVRYMSSFIPIITDPITYKGRQLLPILFVIVLIFVATLLWFFPLTVAKKILPNINPSPASVPLAAKEIELVAFTVLGLWMLAHAIPDVFYWGTFVYMIKSSNLSVGGLRPEQVSAILATIIELAIGLWLLVSSNGIIQLIRKVRYVGHT